MATMDGHAYADDTVLMPVFTGMEVKNFGSGVFLPQLGSTPIDATPPVIENMTPDPEIPAGEPGGFPASYAAARVTPIAFDVVDAAPGIRYIVLTARYGTGAVAVVYDAAGDGFQAGWSAVSTVAPIEGGYHFSVRPDAGWPAGASLAFAVRAVDQHGNLEVGEGDVEPEDTLLSITVSGPAGTWRPTASGDRRAYTASGTYAVSGTTDVSGLVTWSSTAPGVASVAVNGEATPLTTGSTFITATIGAVSGNAALTIDTDRDATADRRCPVNAFQWTLGGYTVDGIYLCQEASGNLTDSGPGAVTLTANATPLYQVAAPGWARVGVGFNGTLNQRFTAASGAGPSPAAVDTFWCFYAALPVVPPATGRMVLVNGTNNNVSHLATTGYLRKTTPGSTVDDMTTLPHVDDLVHPIGLLHDSTSTRTGLFTDEAKTLGTHAAVSDSIKGIGSGTPPEAGSVYVYGFRMRDAAARMSDAAIKTLYQWLGFSVPWS